MTQDTIGQRFFYALHVWDFADTYEPSYEIRHCSTEELAKRALRNYLRDAYDAQVVQTNLSDPILFKNHQDNGCREDRALLSADGTVAYCGNNGVKIKAIQLDEGLEVDAPDSTDYIPRRGDSVERWLVSTLDRYPGTTAADLLTIFRMRADTGVPLDAVKENGQ